MKAIDVKKEITKIIMNMGIRPKLKGFNYLAEALSICYMNEDYMENITNVLYPMVAKNSGATWQMVERNIRTAINDAVESIHEGEWEPYFRAYFNRKPTNMEFISSMLLYIKDQFSEES